MEWFPLTHVGYCGECLGRASRPFARARAAIRISLSLGRVASSELFKLRLEAFSHFCFVSLHLVGYSRHHKLSHWRSSFSVLVSLAALLRWVDLPIRNSNIFAKIRKKFKSLNGTYLPYVPLMGLEVVWYRKNLTKKSCETITLRFPNCKQFDKAAFL